MLALFRLFRNDNDVPICIQADPHKFNLRLKHKGTTYRYVGVTPIAEYDTRRYACAWDLSEETDCTTLVGRIVPHSSTKRIRPRTLAERAQS